MHVLYFHIWILSLRPKSYINVVFPQNDYLNVLLLNYSIAVFNLSEKNITEFYSLIYNDLTFAESLFMIPAFFCGTISELERMSNQNKGHHEKNRNLRKGWYR